MDIHNGRIFISSNLGQSRSLCNQQHSFSLLYFFSTQFASSVCIKLLMSDT